MAVGVNPPKTPITKGSNGIAIATLPNICKMPGPPAPFVPAPLPNIGKSGDKPKGYTKKVKVEGKSVAVKGASFGSMGDMASKGTGGGMVSANTHGPCKFIGPGSMDVKFEGKNVHQLSDPVTNNGGGSGSPANAATLQGTTQGSTGGGGGGGTPQCPPHDWHIPPPKSSDDANKKKQDLRATGDSGDKFEADAADHNNVTDGDCMSGPKEDQKLYAYCKICGKRADTEIDHVERDQHGNVTHIVECKSGNCHIKARQMNTQQEIANSLGATHEVKLEAGDGADKAQDFIKGKPWNVTPTPI